MFKQQRIFMILLILALQFQLLRPVCGEFWLCFCGRFWRFHSQIYVCSPSTSLLNLFLIHLKDYKEVTDTSRVRDEGEEEFSLDTKANNATKVQNTILPRT